MKNILALSGIFLPCFLIAQITQPGVVWLQNSGKTPLSDVQITAPGAEPALSLGNGAFSLVLPSKNKDEYTSVSVEKPGYEVVNGWTLINSRLDPDNMLVVLMCPVGETERRRKALYDIHEKKITADYEAQVFRLRNANAASPDTLAVLEARYHRKLDRLGAFNDDLIQTNLDEVSALRRQALGCYERGALDSAILALPENQIAATSADTSQNEQFVKYQTILAWTDKANFYALKGDLINAKMCFRNAVAVDTTDGDLWMRYAYFLNAEHEYGEVVSSYRKALSLIEEPDLKGIILLNLGAFYKNSGLFEDAEQSYKSALTEYRALSRNAPESFRHWEAETLVNLGELYYNYEKLEAGEAAFREALPIYRELVAKDPEAFKPRLAYTLYNLAVIEEALLNAREAESAYLESQAIYGELAIQNPEGFLSNHANLSYLLGELYLHIEKPVEAEAAYKTALAGYNTMKARGDEGFEYFMAESLFGLGEIEYNRQHIIGATNYYRGALDAYRAANQREPGRYSIHVAATLYNLGSVYNSAGKAQDAVSAYAEAVEIYRQLAAQNPAVHQIDLADALYNLGFSYSQIEKPEEAERAYAESFSLLQQEEAQHPGAYKVKLANNSFNLGLNFIKNGKLPEAEQAFQTALENYRQLVPEDPDFYKGEVASAYARLAEVYEASKQPEAAEKAALDAFNIYRELAKDGTEEHRLKAAMKASDLGVIYYNHRKIKSARESFLIELDLWRGLVKDHPGSEYEDRLALASNNLGVQYEAQKNYTLALNFYEESVKMREAALLQKKTDDQLEWQRVYINILQVRDSALEEENFPVAAQATLIAAQTTDHLQNLDQDMKSDAITNYNNHAWLALFSGEYVLAEQSARRCLEIDPGFYHVNARIGYALLLQGKEKQAKKAFSALKGKSDKKGRPYKEVLLKQFEVIESENLTPPGGWDDIRKWVAKW